MSEEQDNKHEPTPLFIKPIRPFTLHFTTQEELQHFINEARNPTITPEIERLRELLKQHIPSKRRK